MCRWAGQFDIVVIEREAPSLVTSGRHKDAILLNAQASQDGRCISHLGWNHKSAVRVHTGLAAAEYRSYMIAAISVSRNAQMLRT